MLPSSAPPDPALVEAIAADLGVDPSFVEKDWYAVRLGALVAGTGTADAYPVFSGGTSLSKAHGLIQRFSEDLDFKFALPAGLTRSGERALRRRSRQAIIDAIRADSAFTLDDADILIGAESRFLRCHVAYGNHFAPTVALRPHLQVEITFDPPALVPIHCAVRSFVAKAHGEPPELPEIACVSPVETAADKLSALCWRVTVRQRGTPQDDPVLIRHLHDLAALEPLAAASPDFAPLFLRIAAEDASRGNPSGALRTMTPPARLDAMFEQLNGDPEYPAEYDRFVHGMSYARESETPSFEEAIARVRHLALLCT